MRKKRVLTSALVLWTTLGAAGWVDKEASAQTIRRSTQAASAPRGATPQLALRARSFEPYILQAARRYAVDPRALWAIAFLETGFRPELVSVKGARGMMQFMPGTAVRFGLINAHDPVAAIEAAARYVRFLSNRYSYNPALVLAAYNAGEGAVDAYLHGVTIRLRDGKVINPTRRRTGGVPPYMETISYVSRGLSVMRQVNDIGVFSQGDLAACRVPLFVPPTVNSNQQSDFSSDPARTSAGLMEPSDTSPGSVPVAPADARETALVPTSIFAREPINAEISAKIVGESGVSEGAKGGVPSSTTVSRLAADESAVQPQVLGEVHAARSGTIETVATGASASRIATTPVAAVEAPRIPTSSRARRD